jgi:hypothetical protein
MVSIANLEALRVATGNWPDVFVHGLSLAPTIAMATHSSLSARLHHRGVGIAGSRANDFSKDAKGRLSTDDLIARLKPLKSVLFGKDLG